MDRGELLYEGKAKQLYATPDPDLLIQHFKDDATAFNAKKRGTILDKRDIVLVDMKLEFGRHHGKILLADEICPDTCRLWDKGTGEKLDKDRFRRDLGGVEDAYQEAARRICSAAA